MKKVQELRMTLLILVVGIFLLSGCFFSKKVTVSFKTNGGTSVSEVVLKSGSTLDEPDEPTKDGYTFLGWYLDGEEFDFNTEIDEDTTLVAKWAKAEAIADAEDVVEETTETTTTKAVETTNSSETVVTTTVATTVSSSSNTNTLTNNSSSLATGTQTEENTQAVVVTPTVPAVVEPTTEVVTTTKKINITQLTQSDVVTNEDIYVYKVDTDSSAETPNVVNNISNTDYNTLVDADMTTFTIEDNNGNTYTSLTSISSHDVITSLSIYNDTLQVTLDYDTVNNNWVLKYATVKMVTGSQTLETEQTHYYNNIETANKLAEDGDIITLLYDQTLTGTLTIKKAITIDGYSNKTYHAINLSTDLVDTENHTNEYVFIIDFVATNPTTDVVTIKGIHNTNKVNQFLKVTPEAELKEVDLYNLSIIIDGTNQAVANNTNHGVKVNFSLSDVIFTPSNNI